MKKVLLGFAVLTAGLMISGCLKNKESGCPYEEATVTRVDTQAAKVKDYLDDKGITGYVEDPSGLFYTIQSAGTGTVVPTACSLVVVNYKGKLTNETVFDQSTEPVSFYLGGVIAGWQKGLNKIKSGGKITLYIPPYMGYGSTDRKNPNTGEVVIPANSILIFDVDLLDVQ
ncbi:MAG: FKBP-type peptidyl-prolyl cis-trans isomerase [Chitinophagaceae bacterium]|nr:FKBP-type peptidyl-prolyl cis-trans isomerase [Chitinophagaceae bacterium]MCW5928967.1 FKBP-type peptidyl-prolyl cis-trans isomerase [Chitinophagaceae bacterium]